MPANQFLSPEGDLENYFLTEYWLIDQYIGSDLYVWGSNRYGQIGDNTAGSSAVPEGNSRSTPRQVGTATNWKQVSAGSFHTAAIKTDGTLWCWGYNFYGQLGDGGTDRSTPRQVGTATNWKQVSAGDAHTAAIKTDGTLWSWGDGTLGQMGDNTTTSRGTPRQEFTSSTNWKQVDAGTGHTVALKTDGTVWCWGWNRYGQIGDNTAGSAVSTNANSRSTPRQVGTATNWKQVRGLVYTTSALKTDGTLWSWGYNTFGTIGDNTTNDRSTPRQEAYLQTDWMSIGGHNSTHNVAIRANKSIWLWGRNNSGQLGNNTTTNRSLPIQEFTASTNWKQASSGGNFSVAIKTNGTLWAWGYNYRGAIGDYTSGTAVNTNLNTRSTPRQEFTSSTNWKQVSGGGGGHTAAIRSGIEMDTGTITT
jgi:alpha-tubulin suppressor-like RCC1 family protein